MSTHEKKTDPKKVSTKDRNQDINPAKTEETDEGGISTQDRNQDIRPSK